MEDTRHFLISCSNFSTYRDKLFANIEIILHRNNLCLMTVENVVELLIYGHSSLKDSDNANILLATIDYITETKRFAK